jgi:hypothetical protein
MLVALALAAFTIVAGATAATDARQAIWLSRLGGVAARTAAENETTARSDAGSLLIATPLPAGATQSSAEPSGAGSGLAEAGITPATPNLVDDHEWWTVPGPRADVIEYVEAHRPAGTSESLCGPSTTNGVIESECAYFAWPTVPGSLTTRWLVVEAVQLPDGVTGLRADAEVVWVTPRPASEKVPAGARLLRISVSGYIKANQPRQRPLTVTSAKKIEKIAALIDALPAEQPGRFVCPADFGIDVRLAFYRRRDGPPLVVANDDPGGCDDVSLTIEGRAQPPLEGGAQLVEGVDHVLGVRLDTAPPLR